MSKRIVYERFLWFEKQVKAKRLPNATILAREFEISVKTAQRDIVFMRDRLGCPLGYDGQLKGYYYENDAFSLPAVTLSAEELSSLLLAKQLLHNVAGSYLGKELSIAIDKISIVINQGGATAENTNNVVSMHFCEYSPVHEGIFQSALKGCVQKRLARMVYLSPAADAPTERTIEPYHLYNYSGTWYLIAFCHLRKQIRNFHLQRISKIQILDQKQDAKRKLDIRRHFASSFGLYKGQRKAMVTLRIRPEKARWVEGLVWHQNQTRKLLKDGSLEINFPVAHYSEILMEILRHGSGVEVIKPKELRALVKAEAQIIANLY